MSERSGCGSGVPCWAELSSGDVTLSVRFYREIFGWEAVFDPRPESGGRGRFTLGGKAVAGIGPSLGDGALSAWSVHPAAEPGALAWNGPVPQDTAACASFHPAVFGWEVRDGGAAGARHTEWQAADGHRAEWQADGHRTEWQAVDGHRTEWAVDEHRTEWAVDGHSVAGTAQAGPWPPPGARSRRLACFATADVEAAVARAEELGATVIVPRTPAPGGPAAVLADPQSAVFAVVGRDGPPV